jgi:predicted permease
MSLMTWLDRARSSVRLAAGLFGRSPRDAELDEELEFHVAQATERNVRRGMSADEARRAALAAFGGRAYWADEARDQQRSRLFDDFARDLQYGANALRRNRGFAISAGLTVSLGIAATTTVFSFINTVYLRPLDVPEGTRLVRIYVGDRPDLDRELGFPAYRLLRASAHAFDHVVAHYSTAPLYVTARSESSEVMGAVVSGDYFAMLGVKPVLGRFFSADEDAIPDRDAVAVIGHGLWQSRFGGERSVLGEHLTINGRVFTIIGVAPATFDGAVPGWGNELWIPTMMLHTGYRWCDGFERTCAITSVLARLAPGVSLGDARAEVSALRASLLDATDPADSIRTIAVEPATGVQARQRLEYSHLSTLLSAIALVLMAVACANLSGLLLARGIARQKELALRCSLGASRWRVARQLITESLIIAAGGSAAGLLLSIWTSRALVGVLAADSEGYVRRLAVPLDWRVASFAVAATVVAVVFFGVFPALRVSRVDPAETLKGGAGGSLTRSRARTALVAGQMMLALSLLVAAGLLTRSVARVLAAGEIDSAHLVQVRLRPRLVGYTPERAQAYLARATEAIRRVPGVVDAIPVRGSIASQSTDRVPVALPGDAPATSRNPPEIDYFDVGPRFFATLHVPVLVGREFTNRDTPAGPRVALVNEVLARRLWSTIDVVGRTVMLDGKPFHVVGVVGNYRLHRTDEAPPATAYVAFWQSSFEPQIDARVAIRVAGDVAQIFSPVRRALERVDAAVPVTETITMDAQRRATYTEVRLGGAVLAVSALLALFLSAVGLYGVVSFVVARRAKEVGIRLAIGARPGEVVALFVRQGLRPMWLGAGLGVTVSVGLSPLLSRWLFGISPIDLPTLAGAVAVVILVAVGATWVPARRAARADPAVVFRTD